MPRLSVIVPVYNVEVFLPECIESILNQTMRDLELILIDDGSPDNCGAICDKFASQDSRVTVIHQRNQGVSCARNAGLRLASGDYIGFVDPDDFVAPEMFSELIHNAEKNECDIAICGYINCSEAGEHLTSFPVPPGLFGREELLLSIYESPNYFYGSLWNKVFSKNSLKGLLFDESIAIGEDWLMLLSCYQRVTRAVSVSECYYLARARSNSATRSYSADLFVKKMDTYLKLYQLSKPLDKPIRKKAADKVLDACLVNKKDIIRYDYDRERIAYLNRIFRRVSIRELLCGNLSVKKTIYYFSKGLQY